MSIDKIVWVCDTCGSTDVEEKVWRKCNSAICSGMGEAYYEDSWCCDCENNCNIISQEEYDNTTNSANDVNEEKNDKDR